MHGFKNFLKEIFSLHPYAILEVLDVGGGYAVVSECSYYNVQFYKPLLV